MTWQEFAAARQLLAEETVGRVLRQAEAAEDAEFNASMRALRGA